KNGGLLLIFPAGEVSHFDFRAAAVRDPEWRTTAARLIRLTGAKTLPILIRGTNSLPFQMLGMVHPRLRTAALPAELVNKRGKTVEVRIGSLIEPSQMALLRGDESAIRYLRVRTDLLARRGGVPGKSAPGTRPLAPAAPADLIEAEIGALPPDCRLVDDGREFTAYLAAANQIPLALKEIGRLREVTFRAAGEGTGNPLDLDRFDRHYMHLFVWNRKKQQIVGAYRIGDVPALLSRFGRKGLYTDTLFRFSRGFLENLGPALELGRSFVRPEYQRQFAPLLLLWKGISAFVARRPHYSTLIGAVSISNQYSRASRELIARYFENSGIAAVRGRRPRRKSLVPKWEIDALCSLVSNADDLSDPISDLEPDGKGIPVLVKQYLKLGGQLLAFSVDPRFGNTLDGFVMLDLTRTAPEILGRYMGNDRAKEFFAWHAAMAKRVA
ncbi:MAG TPA: GNAT family N-acyltransferase, partial [Bryobacteraceae bacterium]|nr:GNAT family N-acyltransferase [Bryobacteraceae bacterium]